jgi:hypothetical protein
VLNLMLAFAFDAGLNLSFGLATWLLLLQQ